jgi:hypothetical protein
MSGTFCGGCGEGDLVSDPKGRGSRPVVCDLCGWTADAEELPRKWLDDEDAPPWSKRERKKAGLLYFLWVDLDPENDDATDAVIRILGLSGMSLAPRVLIELGTRPSEETLGRLAAVPGVTKVWLAP